MGRLRPGGLLLLSTPAWQHRFGAADVMAGHFRRYDPSALRDLLTVAGLVEVEVRHFGMPLGYALEAARNLVGRRRAAGPESMAERIAGSGRLLQPTGRVAASAIAAGTAPFRLAQRVFPHAGPGLVARGRRPLGSGPWSTARRSRRAVGREQGRRGEHPVHQGEQQPGDQGHGHRGGGGQDRAEQHDEHRLPYAGPRGGQHDERPDAEGQREAAEGDG